MLYIIGIGLNDEKDITVKGLEAVKKCKKVYLETYTSVLQCSVKELEKFYGKKIIEADRNMVEKEPHKTILKDAKKQDVAFLVIGDPLSATTHLDIMLRAQDMKIKVEIINNASVLTAVGVVGLELYKYGKTTSIPFPEKNYKPETFYEVIWNNEREGMHTLLLLDLRPKEKKFMTVNQAIKILLDINKKQKDGVFTEDTLCIGCARLGSDKPFIKAGKAKDLLKKKFGDAPHCLIVPGKLHFMEEEALKGF